ncbi:hypothetical protein GQ53DRAFT_705263, partial [Thozetella sp. PMI_491]
MRSESSLAISAGRMEICEPLETQSDVLAPDTVAEGFRPLPSAMDGMVFWERIFPRAMSVFTTQHPREPKGRAECGFSIRTSACWSDVYGTLQSAKDLYEHPKGYGGVIRKSIRKVATRSSQPLHNAIAFVPEIEYIKPVLGALEILSIAAKRTTQVRAEISNRLHELEQKFGDMEIYLMTFPADENITAASTKLVSSTLKAIEDVIGYYTRNEVSKAVSAIFNGDQYQKSLVESLESITSSSQELIHQAESSNMWQNRQTLEFAQGNSVKLDHMLRQQQAASDAQQKMQQMFKMFEANMNQRFECLEWQNSLLAAQVDYYRTLANSHSLQAIRFNTHPLPRAIAGLLDMPPLESIDIDYILQNKERVPREDRARSERILPMSQLQDWITAPANRELLIQGDFQGTQYSSGLSVLCCSLIQALQSIKQYRCVAFFCGRHLEDEDAHAGPQGMIRSLLSQLLRQQNFDTRGLDSNINPSAVESGDIGQLCLLFEWLVCQLPVWVPLFCIIDGIKYYERENYVEDMSEVLAFLLNLTRNKRIQCVVKIIVVSPSETRVVRQAFSKASILSTKLVARTGQGSSHARLIRILE